MPTFPAFDDVEPPPLSRRARLARGGLGVGVVAAVAVTATAVLAVRDGGPDAVTGPQPAASVSVAPREGLPDGILYLDSEQVSVADPDGGRPEPIAVAFPTTQTRFRLTLSPDRRAAVTEDGFLVALDRPGLVTPQRLVPAGVDRFESVAENGFGDGGRRLAVHVTRAGRPHVAMLTVADGSVTLLGPGTAAAGDPLTTGAAYTVGGREVLVDPSNEVRINDADAVVLHQPGDTPHPVITKQQFRTLLGVGAVPVDFFDTSFSPDGQLLAVTGLAMTRDPGPFGPTGRFGVVVLTRAGEVVAVRKLARDHFVGDVAWSPGGDQLLVADFFSPSRLTRPTAEVFLYSIGAGTSPAPTLLKAPQGQQPFGHVPCLWSPDGARVLCGDERAWYVLAVGSGESFVAESVPGAPMAWVEPE